VQSGGRHDPNARAVNRQAGNTPSSHIPRGDIEMPIGSGGDASGEAACCIAGVAADVGAATCGVQGWR